MDGCKRRPVAAETTSRAVRVIHDGAHGGPVNMARDEALFAALAAGDAPPTLRFYTWANPTISLGYFQKYADYAALPAPAGELPVVRRPTGGGAILHDRELTYALAVPTGHVLLSAGPNCLYERMHAALIAVLAGLGARGVPSGISDDSGPARGPFFCFARRHKYDVLLADAKLAGSAQRRSPRAVLQHGSIVLANRFAQHPVAVATELAEETPRTLADRLTDRLIADHDLHAQPGHWQKREEVAWPELIAKHTTSEWLKRS
jgi:lipoate-protein ligase A